MNALLLNLALALLWLLLRPVPTHTHFAIGFVLGFAFIAGFRCLLGAESYVRRSLGLLHFLGSFLRAFLHAYGSIFFLILFRPRGAMRPGFLNYEVAGLTRTEVLILAQCISLTPGTTTVEINDDFSSLVLHAMDAADADAVCRDIDRHLRAPLLEVTR